MVEQRLIETGQLKLQELVENNPKINTKLL